MEIYKHIEVMEMPEQCPICGVPSMAGLFDVYEDASLNEIKWRCSICGQPFYYGNKIEGDRYFYCYFERYSVLVGSRNFVLRYDTVEDTALAFYRTREKNEFFEVNSKTIDLLSVAENREKILAIKHEPRLVMDAATYRFQFYQGASSNLVICHKEDFSRFKILDAFYHSIVN